ncbi:MAG: coenzyme F420-0:L-glutamate ligase [Candidatus Peribacteraceae bacterium]|nr:coenzyme F420-0:L-glutamate ligase [Candidatus Peribacteraceae bacterium]
MQILPVPTGLLKKGDNLARILSESMTFGDGDILAVSSKAVATAEGAAIDLAKIAVTPEAEQWAKRCGRSAAFRQAILDETKRLNGIVLSGCKTAMLTELHPQGMEGSLLVPNAGLDQSNIAEGSAIGWPHDPVTSVHALRTQLQKRTGKRIAVLLTDSCCRPRRWGVTAFALVVSGFDPLSSQIGKKDLFGNTLTMTQEAVADQLATAANAVMGNANQSVPAALIREHGIPLSGFAGWVPGIAKEEDLFAGAF